MASIEEQLRQKYENAIDLCKETDYHDRIREQFPCILEKITDFIEKFLDSEFSVVSVKFDGMFASPCGDTECDCLVKLRCDDRDIDLRFGEDHCSCGSFGGWDDMVFDNIADSNDEFMEIAFPDPEFRPRYVDQYNRAKIAKKQSEWIEWIVEKISSSTTMTKFAFMKPV